MTDAQIDDLALRYASILTTGGGLREFARAVAKAERERCADLCRSAMPQPVANWADAQIVEALRLVLEKVVGPNVYVTR